MCVGESGAEGLVPGGTEIFQKSAQSSHKSNETKSFVRKAAPTYWALLHFADPGLLVIMKGDCRTLQQRLRWLL